VADAIFGLILFYSLILGARRGFFKEVIHVVALIVSIGVARQLREPAGASLANVSALPLMLAEVAAMVAIWVVTFLVVAVVGRLVLKKLQGRGIDDQLDDGADAIADAISGDSGKGPITRLTDPLASKEGFFYWSDKLLGALLGFVKGLITGYVVLGLAIYADRARGWNSSFAQSIEGSYAAAGFEQAIEPFLVSFPEYRIATSLRELNRIADLVSDEPSRLAALKAHPELKALSNQPALLGLLADPEIKQAWDKGQLKQLLFDAKVRAVLKDGELRQRVAEVNWERVRVELEAGLKPPPPPPPQEPR
jgi:uncharacterized membrane protein required for colicin V production